MESGSEFNLHEAVQAVTSAAVGIICHIFFDAGWHGLVIALLLGIVGVVFKQRGHRLGAPFVSVCKRLSIVCAGLLVPGGIAIAVSGHLPSTGVFSVNSLGYIVFWSMICVHLCAEEMNHRGFESG